MTRYSLLLTLGTATAVGAGSLFAGSSHAATLTSSVSATGVDSSVDNLSLTDGGTIDWVYYDEGNDSDGFNSNEDDISNSKATGSGISDLMVTGGNPAARDFTPGHTFQYSDGESPTNDSNFNPGTSFVGNLDGDSEAFLDLDGTSISITVEGDPALGRTFTLYGAVKRASIDITASLNGAADETESFGPPSGDTGTFDFVYSVDFLPDSASDELTVTLTPTGSVAPGSNFNSIRFGAATLAPVPEPASLAVLAAGGLCLLPRRRRHIG